MVYWGSVKRLPILLGGLLLSSLSWADNILDYFVDIRDVSPRIRVNMMYFTRENFTGEVVPGYLANVCYLLPEVAEALGELQLTLEKEGLGLEVRDCYRPVIAVKHFNSWLDEPALNPTRMQDIFFPLYKSRAQLKAAKYIAEKSPHSCGHAVDLTVGRLSRTGAFRPWDMGSPMDFFDPASRTTAVGKVGSREISPAQANHRRYLFNVMRAASFLNYDKEWWHYQYRGPFRGNPRKLLYRDFDVVIPQDVVPDEPEPASPPLEPSLMRPFRPRPRPATDQNSN